MRDLGYDTGTGNAPKRGTVVLVAATALALLATACGGNSSSDGTRLGEGARAAAQTGSDDTSATSGPSVSSTTSDPAPSTTSRATTTTIGSQDRTGDPAVASTSSTTQKATVTTRAATTTSKATTTTTRAATTTVPVNRRAITSYNRITPGAPHYGPFRSAWQPFTASSNTITYLAATVGGGSGSSFTIRLTTAGTDGCGTGVIAGGNAGVVQYGESGVDIGDVAVTPGATYYICYNSPNYPTINSWVTYWWAGGSTISTSDQMQAKVQGYNR